MPEVIGTLKSSGNSSSLLSYSFIDESPSFGQNYYRLNAIDMDGFQEYSEIIGVNVLPTPLSLDRVYPNPAVDVLRIDFASEVKEVSLRLLTLEGKVITERSSVGHEGHRKEELDLTTYPRGIYLLQVSDGFSSKTSKVILTDK